MGQRFLALSGVWLLACAVLAAADFWEEKEFTAWSDRNVEKMMTNSPWAKRVTVVFPRPPPLSRGGGGAAGGVAIAGGATTADRGGGAIRSSQRTILIVQWRSALPMRQALVRGQMGQGGTVDARGQEILTQSPPGYFVVVTGIPRQFGRLTPEALMAEARLERKGKSPIVPVQAGAEREEAGLALVYIFPRNAAIALEDKDVEFVAKVGDTTIKKKFKLKDMVFNDQLEL